MPVTPWYENWPVLVQLWQVGTKNPGDELSFADPGRSLSAEWRRNGITALTVTEGVSLSVVDERRGLVRIVLSKEQWRSLNPETVYTVHIFAYGVEQGSFLFNSGLPKAGSKRLGAEVYASPREILELIGLIPGADVQTTVDLSPAGWALNDQGYWVAEFVEDQKFYGLWIDDKQAVEVKQYEDLALVESRAWWRSRNLDNTWTIYVNCAEDLGRSHVETAFSVYVLRSLAEATAEIERRAGRVFSLHRHYREVYNVQRRQDQLFPRNCPVHVDDYFRVDCFSRSRKLVSRYDETDTTDQGGDRLHVEAETGITTLLTSFWDWQDWTDDPMAWSGIQGQSFFSPGKNSLEITYTSGYDSIPTDLAEACANLAAIRQLRYWNQLLTQGTSGLSIGCLNINFGQSFLQFAPQWQQEANSIIDSYTSVSLSIW